MTGTRRCDHISSVLRQLHWLPVRQRVVFKIATVVYGLPVLVRQRPGARTPVYTGVRAPPSYLADDCQLVADFRVRQLRCQADAQQFWRQDLCRRRTTSLPPNLRLCGLSYGQFRRLLKTLLFGERGHSTE